MNHLVRAQQYRRRDAQTECLRSFQVHGQFEFRRLPVGRSPALAPFKILSTNPAAC
jgi:hypothetical protein